MFDPTSLVCLEVFDEGATPSSPEWGPDPHRDRSGASTEFIFGLGNFLSL